MVVPRAAQVALAQFCTAKVTGQAGNLSIWYLVLYNGDGANIMEDEGEKDVLNRRTLQQETISNVGEEV